jgi:hypothetical protein
MNCDYILKYQGLIVQFVSSYVVLISLILKLMVQRSRNNIYIIHIYDLSWHIKHV